MSNRFSRKNILITGLVVILLTCVMITGCSKVNENKENMVDMTNESKDINKTEYKENKADEIIQEENAIISEEANETISEEAVELETVIEEQPQEVVITEKVDAPYEYWLAANMVVASIMKYPELEITDICLTGETEISSKTESEGVYIVFGASDEKIIIHSKPLDGERKEEKTTDLYSANLGFATFDIVEVEFSKLESCKRIDLEQLDKLISQSLLISIYEH